MLKKRDKHGETYVHICIRAKKEPEILLHDIHAYMFYENGTSTAITFCPFCGKMVEEDEREKLELGRDVW